MVSITIDANFGMKSNPVTSTVLDFTENAARKLKSLMEEENNPNLKLRVSVYGGGCSGFQYQMAFEDTANENDKVFVSNGVRVFIDMKSALYLAGTEVDYLNGLMESGFKITNPNAQTTCGCGQSFR